MGLRLFRGAIESPGQRNPIAPGASAPRPRAGDRNVTEAILGRSFETLLSDGDPSAQPFPTVRGDDALRFQLESELDELLSRPVHNQAARNLKERFLTHRDKLLVFLHDPDVPPTNNESERALRPSVIHRKVTNGFRSEWGAKAYAALQSVIATARLRGENIFDALVKLMGKPIDRYIQPTNP
jgi:transposase